MQRYGPFEVNQVTYGNFSWVMTEQNVSHFCLLIYYSEPFCLGKVKITNTLVLADRNVVTDARGDEGGAVF